jgi:hypothetical protein
VLPLAKVAFEAHTFGHLKRCDETALNPLASLVGTLASGAVFSSRPVEVSGEFVVLAGLELGRCSTVCCTRVSFSMNVSRFIIV